MTITYEKTATFSKGLKGIILLDASYLGVGDYDPDDWDNIHGRPPQSEYDLKEDWKKNFLEKLKEICPKNDVLATSFLRYTEKMFNEDSSKNYPEYGDGQHEGYTYVRDKTGGYGVKRNVYGSLVLPPEIEVTDNGS